MRYILSLNLPSCELVDSAVAADIPCFKCECCFAVFSGMMAAQSDEQLGATDEPDPAGFAAEEKADPALWDRNGTHVDILQFSVFPQQLFIKSFFFFSVCSIILFT